MYIWKYGLKDAKEGILRNKKASFSATLLIFLSLTLTGLGLLFHFTFNQVTTYLENQMTIRVMLTDTHQTTAFLTKMDKQPTIQQMKVESGEETYEKLKHTLHGKEGVLASFKPHDFPPTVIIQVKKGKSVTPILEELNQTKGIKHVFYPKKVAQILVSWTTAFSHYAWGFVGLFLLASFLTVYMTINLSFLQRKKDIQLKLLLGARPLHIYLQFLLEGILLGGLGSVLAISGLIVFTKGILFPLEKHVTFLTGFDFSILSDTCFIVLGIGIGMGLIGSYLSIQRDIKNI